MSAHDELHPTTKEAQGHRGEAAEAQSDLRAEAAVQELSVSSQDDAGSPGGRRASPADYPEWVKRRAVQNVLRGLTAADTVDVIVAMKGNNEILGAVDARKPGARARSYWRSRHETPFEIHLLRRVPLKLAEDLADIGTRGARMRDGRKAWREVQRFRSGGPFFVIR